MRLVIRLVMALLGQAKTSKCDCCDDCDSCPDCA